MTNSLSTTHSLPTKEIPTNILLYKTTRSGSIYIPTQIFMYVMNDFLDWKSIRQCGIVNRDWRQWANDYSIWKRRISSLSNPHIFKDMRNGLPESVCIIPQKGTTAIYPWITRFLANITPGSRQNTFQCFFAQNSKCMISIELGTGTNKESESLCPARTNKIVCLYMHELPPFPLVELIENSESPGSYYSYHAIIPLGTDLLAQSSHLQNNIKMRKDSLEKRLKKQNTIIFQIFCLTMLLILIWNSANRNLILR